MLPRRSRVIFEKPYIMTGYVIVKQPYAGSENNRSLSVWCAAAYMACLESGGSLGGTHRHQLTTMCALWASVRHPRKCVFGLLPFYSGTIAVQLYFEEALTLRLLQVALLFDCNLFETAELSVIYSQVKCAVKNIRIVFDYACLCVSPFRC